MKLVSRRTLAAGAATLALLVGGGSALAFDPLGDQDAFLGDLATRLGIEQEELEGAIRDAQVTRVDQAEAEGQITDEQATELRERIEAAETPFIGGGGFRGGFGFRGGPGGFLEPAAEALGLSAAGLRDQLGGTSLAAIAAEQGVSVQAVEDAIVAAQEKRLDEAVADGRITDAQAAELLNQLESRAEALVDRVFPEEGALCDGPPPADEDSGTDEEQTEEPTEGTTEEEVEL